MNLLLKYAKVITPFSVYRGAKLFWQPCPNCQQQIDIELALRLSSWSKLAPSNCGVRCPNCKMVLAARQRRVLAAAWAVLALGFALVLLGITTGRLTRISVFLTVLGLAIFAVFMQRWKLRSLIKLSLPPLDVELREVHPSAKDYAYLEGRNGHDQELRIEPATTDDSQREWICSNCERSNPASFDLCWKCNHRQPGRTK